MFDIGWTELAIVALIALLVIGPKDLPKAMQTIAGWINRIRGLAREFQSGIDEMVREAELDGIKEKFGATAGTDLDAMVENTIDPDGTFASEFDLGEDFVPPDETVPKPRKKKSAKAKPATKRAAGAKTKRAPAGSAAKKVAAKKPATKKPVTKPASAKPSLSKPPLSKPTPAKRTVAKKAPAGSPTGKART